MPDTWMRKRLEVVEGCERRRLQQVVKYERRVVRFKRHLCLSIKFTRLSFQHCAGCHFVSPIAVSYSRSRFSRFPPFSTLSSRVILATIPTESLVSLPFALLVVSLATNLPTYLLTFQSTFLPIYLCICIRTPSFATATTTTTPPLPPSPSRFRSHPLYFTSAFSRSQSVPPVMNYRP